MVALQYRFPCLCIAVIFALFVVIYPIWHLRGDALAKAYTEHEAKKNVEYYAQYGNFQTQRAVKGKEGWKIEELQLPHQQFKNDVRAGKIKEKGLKLSENQIKGKAPTSGYLQAVAGAIGLSKKESPSEKEHYRPGLVVKITGDFDDDLKDHHNTYGVITDVIDPWHYKISQEYSGERKVIRDTDVKAWIGDRKTDYIGIGEERHQKEIVPIIEKAMQDKVPVVHREPSHRVKGGSIGAARRIAGDEACFKREKSRATATLVQVKLNKKRYATQTDYRRSLNNAQDWLDALKQAEREVKKYGRDHVSRLGWNR